MTANESKTATINLWAAIATAKTDRAGKIAEGKFRRAMAAGLSAHGYDWMIDVRGEIRGIYAAHACKSTIAEAMSAGQLQTA